MTIEKIMQQKISFKCDCGEVNIVQTETLNVGVQHQHFVDCSIIPIPQCPSCGRIEFLVASKNSKSHPLPGSFGHKHQLLVNYLHHTLISKNQLVDGADKDNVFTRKPNSEEISKYLKNSLQLDDELGVENAG